MALAQLSVPAGILGTQGLLNSALGLYGLVRPADLIAQTQGRFGGRLTGPVGFTLSLQMLSMGTMAIFAAGAEKRLIRQALVTRSVLHLVAGVLFWREGSGKFRGMAVADVGFAVVNAVAAWFVEDDDGGRDEGRGR